MRKWNEEELKSIAHLNDCLNRYASVTSVYSQTDCQVDHHRFCVDSYSVLPDVDSFTGSSDGDPRMVSSGVNSILFSLTSVCTSVPLKSSPGPPTARWHLPWSVAFLKLPSFTTPPTSFLWRTLWMSSRWLHQPMYRSAHRTTTCSVVWPTV